MRFFIFLSLSLICISSAKAELSLQESLQAAYENNSELKAQNYSVEAARSQKQKSYGGLLPNISADINSGNQNTKITDGATIKGGSNKKSLNLSQDLFNGGATYFDIKRASSVVDKEKAIRDAKEQEITLNVIQAYLNILRYEELLKVEQENLQSQSKMLEHTQAKLTARDATKSEFAKASADHASAVSSKIAVENNLISARNSFSKLTGIELGQIRSLKKIDDESFRKKIADLKNDDLFESALQNNPDIKAARYSVESARHQSSITKSSFSPTVKLSVGASEEKNPLYYSNHSYRNNSAYINVHVPIFSSGVEYANMGEANNILQREKYNLDSARTRIKQQIVEYVSKIRNFYAQYDSLKEQESANEIYVMTLREEERLGTKSIIELLRAKQDLYAAKVNKTNLHYDKIAAIFSLKSLVGELTHGALSDGNVLGNFEEKNVVVDSETESQQEKIPTHPEQKKGFKLLQGK